MACIKGLIAMLFVILAGRLAADPIGMACHIKGQPEIRNNQTKKWESLRLLQKLETGDTVRCKPGSEAIIVLFGNGERYQVGAGQQGEIQTGSVAGAKSLGGLKGPSALAISKLGGSRTGAAFIRTVPGISPTKIPALRERGKFPDWITDTDRVFKWDKNEIAASYTFTLCDPANGDEVVWFAQTEGDHVEVPGSLNLKNYRPYVWRLSVRKKSNEILHSLCRWGVLTQLKDEDVPTIKTETAALTRQAAENSADPLPHVLLAEYNRGYGLLLLAKENLEAASDRKEDTKEERIAVFGQLGYLGSLMAEILRAPQSEFGTIQEGK